MKCPGINSKESGKSKACKGCPNAATCSQPQPADPYISQIEHNLSTVTNLIVIIGGKGGVGKSTVAVGIANTILKTQPVCLVDLDTTGPSLSALTNIKPNIISNKTIFPACKNDLSLITVQNESIGSKGKNETVVKILCNGVFSSDTVVFDTPPNISDEHIAIAKYLKNVKVIIVTNKSKMSLDDSRRSIDFCKKVGFNIVGVICNMDGFMCECGEWNKIGTGDEVEKFCEEQNVKFIGSIPMSKKMAEGADCGEFVDNEIYGKAVDLIGIKGKHLE